MDIKVIASGSSGNCYRVSDGKTALLLDAGIPLKKLQLALDFEVSDIKGCLITHQHADHCKGADEYAMRGIKLYSNVAVSFALDEMSHVNALRGLKKVSLDTWDVLPFFVQHDVPCYAYKLSSVATGESLLYMTDAESFDYKIKGITHLIIEANHSLEILAKNQKAGKVTKTLADRIRQTHMSIETLCEYLVDGHIDTSKLEQVYLVHLSNQNSDAEDFKNRVQEIVPRAEVIVI